MLQQHNRSQATLAIIGACKRYLQKRFSIEWEAESIPQNYMIEFLEDAIGLKVEITEANTLYGYNISGGGAIAKFPRFRTRERAQQEAIQLIFSMLSCSSLDLSY